MVTSLTLELPPRIYCAGSWVKGEVILDLRQVAKDKLEEIQIKLQGTVDTHTKLDGDTAAEHEKRTVAEHSLTLWTHTHGATRPLHTITPESPTLRLPFRILLPERLPPSFHYDDRFLTASVLYTLTVNGLRPGAFRLNRKIKVPLAVLPKDSPGARAGPAKEWRRAGVAEKNIRKGLWGEPATVRVELSLQDIPGGVRLFTGIPFAIAITTTTAPLLRPPGSADDGKPVFPAPPAQHTQLTLKLVRTVRVRAKGQSACTTFDAVHIFGGPELVHRADGSLTVSGSASSTSLSSDATSHSASASSLRARAPPVDTTLSKKEWVPMQGQGQGRGKEQGVWVQRARFQSTLRLNVPPSFASDTLDCEDMLSLKVPFAGLGNDVKLEVPVVIASGLDAPLSREPPPAALALVQEGLESLKLGDPEVSLDLPREYWDSNLRK